MSTQTSDAPTPVTTPPQIHWRAGGQGPALVLINGWAASGLAWPRAFVRDLQSDHRVLRPDNRGSGYSRYAEMPFTIGDLADDVIAMLNDEQIQNATVMGISMGGMIAQEVALRAPERVSALALFATRPPAPEHRLSLFATGTMTMLRPPGRRTSLAAYFNRLWASSSAPGFAERHPDVIDELTQQTLERPMPRGMLIHQMRAMTAWGHADRLERLDVPTIVVHGDSDPIVPRANAHALVRLIPGAQLTLLDDVGHLVPQEAPDRTAALLRELVAEGAAR